MGFPKILKAIVGCLSSPSSLWSATSCVCGKLIFRLTPLVLLSVFASYWILAILFTEYSNMLIDLKSGFIICRSDCTNFHNLSDVIAGGNLFPPATGDWHYGVMFRGFVMYVAALKVIFGAAWAIPFVLINVSLALLSVVLAARLLAKRAEAGTVFVVAAAFLIFSPGFLMLSKFLLSDYLFAVCFGAAAVLFARGLATRTVAPTAFAFAIMAIGFFVRPNGLFVLALMTCLVGAAVVLQLLPERARFPLLAAAGPVAGLCAMLIAVTLTWFLVVHPDTIGALPKSVREFGEVALRHNALGSDAVKMANRLGANIWTFPMHTYAMNDGSWVGIFESVLKRASVVFQIILPPYSWRNNLYRVVYYVPLYGLFLIFAVESIRRASERKTELLLLSFVVGYSLIFVSISPIEIRYRLPMEFVMIVGASLSALRIIKVLGNMRPRGRKAAEVAGNA